MVRFNVHEQVEKQEIMAAGIRKRMQTEMETGIEMSLGTLLVPLG